MVAEIVCPQCASSLPLAPATPAAVSCNYCGRRFWALASVPPVTIAVAAAPALPGSATCFFHAENAAHVACEVCGRFVCALCDLALDGRHRCPSCLAAASAANQIDSLRREDFLYDSLAATVGWAWMVIYPLWVFAAPLVLYLTIAKWSAPRQYLVPRGRWRYGSALLGIAWVVLLIVGLITIRLGRRP